MAAVKAEVTHIIFDLDGLLLGKRFNVRCDCCI